MSDQFYALVSHRSKYSLFLRLDVMLMQDVLKQVIATAQVDIGTKPVMAQHKVIFSSTYSLILS